MAKAHFRARRAHIRRLAFRHRQEIPLEHFEETAEVFQRMEKLRLEGAEQIRIRLQTINKERDG